MRPGLSLLCVNLEACESRNVFRVDLESRRVQAQPYAVKAHQFAEQALVCFIQAMKFQPAYGLFIVPQVLCMLAHSDPAEANPHVAVVKDEIVRHAFPIHVFLPFIGHMMEGLMRGERDTMRLLLQQLMVSHPQAVYYHMRTALLSMRDTAGRLLQDARSKQASQVRSFSLIVLVCTAHACVTSQFRPYSGRALQVGLAGPPCACVYSACMHV